MSDKTNISYCDHTKSPWRGCEKKSAGCAGCYVEDFQRKFGDKLTDRRLVKSFESDAKRWNGRVLEQSCIGQYRPRVFVSLCDWLDDKVPVAWLADFLKVIYQTPNLDWLLLTKRPNNWENRMREAQDYICKNIKSSSDTGTAFFIQLWLGATNTSGPLAAKPPNNIWFGVTCEDQESAWERIAALDRIPAKVRWLSVEPLLEPIDLEIRHGCRSCNHPGSQMVVAINDNGRCSRCDGTGHEPPPFNWVVVGAESGPKRRDCGVEAIIDVAKQCAAAGVPCFVKQDCAARPGQQGRIPDAYWSIKQFPRSNGAGLRSNGAGLLTSGRLTV